MTRIRIAILGLNFGRHICTEIRASAPDLELAAVIDLDRAKAVSTPDQNQATWRSTFRPPGRVAA